MRVMCLFSGRRVTCQLEDITLPKHMAANPIYEQTDGIYDLVMHHTNIAPLGTATSAQAHNDTERCKNGKVCNNKSRSLPPLPNKTVDENVEGDEYVQMSALASKCADKPPSTSPRYTETPGTARKEDDTSEDLPSLHKALP